MAQAVEDKVVICEVCLAPHPALPEVSTRIIGTESITGYHASDYSYVRDLYQGKYVVMCKSHSRDEISERKDSDIDGEYSYNAS